MLVILKRDNEEANEHAAKLIAGAIKKKPSLTLGLATGNTMLGLYRHLVRLHQSGPLDFSGVVTFNLDEYLGLPASHPQSYHHFMHEHFFRHVNVLGRNILLLATGASKAAAVAKSIEGPITCAVSASALQLHPDVTFVLDEPAAAQLAERDYYRRVLQMTALLTPDRL